MEFNLQHGTMLNKPKPLYLQGLRNVGDLAVGRTAHVEKLIADLKQAE